MYKIWIAELVGITKLNKKKKKKKKGERSNIFLYWKISFNLFIIKCFQTIVFIFIVEDNNPKTVNDKNHQASSQKLRQLSYNPCMQ